jgi:hypothetical protein
VEGSAFAVAPVWLLADAQASADATAAATQVDLMT